MNKVWVELDWDQIDSIISKELEHHIEIISKEIELGEHDDADSEITAKELLSALQIVHRYWAYEQD